MNSMLEPFEKERKKIYSKMKRNYTIGVLIFLGSIIAGIYLELNFVFGIGFLVLFFIILFTSSTGKNIKADFKSTIISKLIKDELGPESVYEPTNGILLREILMPGFMRSPDRYTTEDLIKGVYNNIPFEVCDCDFKKKETRVDAQGHSYTEYVTYFKGRFISIDFPREIDIELRIIETSSLGFDKRGQQKVETEVIAFNNKFNVYSNNKEEAFYFLTPSLIQKMLNLESMYKGTIFYAICKGKLYVAINNNGDSLELNIRKPLNDLYIEQLIGEIALTPAIITEFGIDKSKFTKSI